MAHDPSRIDDERRARGVSAALLRVSFAIGALGLLGAMVIDALAVVGRHIDVPLLGSMELSEVCIVGMASASLVGSTLERGHASVHLLTERLASRPRRALRRCADALSALFFTIIVLGSAMIAIDLIHGDERSELLGIPIAPLRWFWCASAAGVVAIFLSHALARRAKP
jgi:TRAP-type C4-dicarboxylate transport system permease small subunit